MIISVIILVITIITIIVITMQICEVHYLVFQAPRICSPRSKNLKSGENLEIPWAGSQQRDGLSYHL